MRKIPNLFKRDFKGNPAFVLPEATEGTEWVLEGEGVATAKIDGTACLVREGKLYKRHELKQGRTAPAGFEPAQEPDPVTGEIPGWVPVGDGPEDKWHRAAFKEWTGSDGTYELIGPKVQGNKYELTQHRLVRHGESILTSVPLSFQGLRDYFEQHPLLEGIVWHHPNGRMVKIKRRDFGLPW